MVEVFKTNVQHADESGRIIQQLLQHYPYNRINFDLSDCDRILRVEGESVCPDKIKDLLFSAGYLCEVLQ
ncbi:MAG: hypothetical protein V4450_06540 [Bacteroidota bacterium]